MFFQVQHSHSLFFHQYTLQSHSDCKGSSRNRCYSLHMYHLATQSHNIDHVQQNMLDIGWLDWCSCESECLVYSQLLLDKPGGIYIEYCLWNSNEANTFVIIWYLLERTWKIIPVIKESRIWLVKVPIPCMYLITLLAGGILYSYEKLSLWWRKFITVRETDVSHFHQHLIIFTF